MFSNNAIETFLSLDNEDKDILDEFIRIINGNDQAEKNDAATDLMTYAAETIFKYGERSAVFKAFCQITRIPSSAWASYLQNDGYPGVDIVADNPDVTCTILDQYLGRYCYKCYLTERNRGQERNDNLCHYLLDKACSHRVLFALLERCELNRQLLTNSSTHEKAVKQIDDDVAVLSELYRSLGCGYACYYQLAIMEYYQNSTGEGANEAATQRAMLAVAAFCEAEITAKTSASVAVNAFILQNKNYFMTVFKQSFNGFTQAKTDYILKFINGNTALYNQIYESVNKAVHSQSPSPH